MVEVVKMSSSDIENIIRTKREIRNFKSDPIPNEIIIKILEAGRLSASSRNSQPWHFIAITDKNVLQQIGSNSPTGKYISNAPLAIAVLFDKKGFKADGGRTVQNMMLQAWEYKIGSVFVSNFNDTCLKILGVDSSSNFEILTIIPFGYLLESDKPKGKKIRKSFDEVISLNKFGSRFPK